MKHHLLLHCQLVEFSLLVRTSAADPIMNMSALDHGRWDQLAWCSWPRRRARRAQARHHCQPDAGDAAAAAVRSLPLPPWGKACRPHNDRASTESLLIAAIMIQRRNIYDGIRD